MQELHSMNHEWLTCQSVSFNKIDPFFGKYFRQFLYEKKNQFPVRKLFFLLLLDKKDKGQIVIIEKLFLNKDKRLENTEWNVLNIKTFINILNTLF